jgi:hypothetical protein
MNDATKRSILRWIQIIFSIPILGYIYGEPSEVQHTPPLFGFFLSCSCPFGILDVERPCPSTTYFETIGLTRRCSEPPTSSAIYGYGKFEPQHCVLNAHRPTVAELER